MAATFEASAAIKPYSLVQLDGTTGKVKPTAGLGNYPLGAVQEVGAAKAGDSVTVHLDGIVLLRAHAAATGNALAYALPQADGRAALAAAIGNNNLGVGRWVQGAAGAQDDLVSVLIDRHAK